MWVRVCDVGAILNRTIFPNHTIKPRPTNTPRIGVKKGAQQAAPLHSNRDIGFTPTTSDSPRPHRIHPDHIGFTPTTSDSPQRQRIHPDAIGFTTYFAAISASVVSSMRLLKPHSLSYQAQTLTSVPPMTCVSVAS